MPISAPKPSVVSPVNRSVTYPTVPYLTGSSSFQTTERASSGAINSLKLGSIVPKTLFLYCLVNRPRERTKYQALNHLRMASRLDACCSRIETAVRMNQVSTGMKGVVKGMVKSLSAMNVEQSRQLMDKFEQQFEDLDVKAEYMEGTMNATTATSTPAEQFSELIGKVADENNLELGEAFNESEPVGTKIQPPAQTEKPAPVQDDLEARLANLRS